ncbi:50S ribosomal protein L11 methyltransferase [soil metagenome]
MAAGTWALRTGVDLDTVNVHLEALEAAGLLGITEEDGRATVWLPERVAGLPVSGEWEAVPDADWHAQWKARLEPVEVGSLRIVPPWKARPHGEGSAIDGGIDLIIEPAQAFGTGHHETTAGCLAALCELDLVLASVLDVGTGTGVLAIAAARLGAATVVAVDTDPLAVAAATDNASANDVRVDVRLGSVHEVHGRFDLVLANLDTATLSSLAPALVARLAARGALIASGVAVERRSEAVAAFAAAGLPVWDRAGGEWVVLVGSATGR